ncbi:hypothetical protein [Sphingopyxis sp. 22461]
MIARLIFRLRMLRFPKAPTHPRAPDGRFVSRHEWRLAKMREGVGG